MRHAAVLGAGFNTCEWRVQINACEVYGRLGFGALR